MRIEILTTETRVLVAPFKPGNDISGVVRAYSTAEWKTIERFLGDVLPEIKIEVM